MYLSKVSSLHSWEWIRILQRKLVMFVSLSPNSQQNYFVKYYVNFSFISSTLCFKAMKYSTGTLHPEVTDFRTTARSTSHFSSIETDEQWIRLQLLPSRWPCWHYHPSQLHSFLLLFLEILMLSLSSLRAYQIFLELKQPWFSSWEHPPHCHSRPRMCYLPRTISR